MRHRPGPGGRRALAHQVTPGLLGHGDVVVGGRAADVLEGLGTAGVGHVLDLVEAAQGGAATVRFVIAGQDGGWLEFAGAR